jgi:hypothetical protein
MLRFPLDGSRQNPSKLRELCACRMVMRGPEFALFVAVAHQAAKEGGRDVWRR